MRRWSVGFAIDLRVPVESVATLARIAAATEPHRARFILWERMKTLAQELQPGLDDLASIAAEAVLEFQGAAAVVVPSETGRMARSIARFRLPVWVAAVTPSDRVRSAAALPGAMAMLLRGPSADGSRSNHAMELLDLGASATDSGSAR